MTSKEAGSVTGRTDREKDTILTWPRFIQKLENTHHSCLTLCALFRKKLTGVSVTDAIQGPEELVNLFLSLALFLSFALVHVIHSINCWKSLSVTADFSPVEF